MSYVDSSVTIKCVNPSWVNALLIEMAAQMNVVILFMIFVPFDNQ
ncbi:hypothetical protein [Priestia megaterium]